MKTLRGYLSELIELDSADKFCTSHPYAVFVEFSRTGKDEASNKTVSGLSSIALLAPDDVRVFPLTSKEGGSFLRIGRSKRLEIVIDDSSISRSHATISIVDGSYRISDSGSTNGVYVGDRRVGLQGQVALSSSEFIKLGNVSFQFYSAEEFFGYLQYQKRLLEKMAKKGE